MKLSSCWPVTADLMLLSQVRVMILMGDWACSKTAETPLAEIPHEGVVVKNDNHDCVCFMISLCASSLTFTVSGATFRKRFPSRYFLAQMISSLLTVQ